MSVYRAQSSWLTATAAQIQRMRSRGSNHSLKKSVREVERAYLQGQFWRQLFSIFAMAAGNLYAIGSGASWTSDVGLTCNSQGW